jgi:protein transport protein SEC24
MASRNLKDIRKALGDRCNKVLLMYRKHCAPAVQPGQVGFPLAPVGER